MFAAFTLSGPAREDLGLHPDAIVRSVFADQGKSWIRIPVTIIVSGFLFAYLSPGLAAAWLIVTLGFEAFSLWTKIRLAAGDMSMAVWHVRSIFAIAIAWVVHALLLWGQPDEVARIAALIDLFVVALYGALGGHKDRRILLALTAPPLITLSFVLIHFAWTHASAPVAMIASFGTIGAVITIAANGWAMHKFDQALMETHRELVRERDSLEARVQARTADLRRAHAALEKASKAKSVFLSTMSHELRTPLNGILGYAELLAEDIRAEAANAEDAERIAEAGRKLLLLINDILDLAALESGQAEIEFVEADVEELLLAAQRSAADIARENGNAVSVSVTPDARFVATDAKRLLHCLRHITENACKFTRNGAVTMTAFRATDAGRAVLKIEVKDTGQGIEPSQIDRLLQPFEQASQGPTRTHEGAGLGLAIAQRVLVLLGGAIGVESAPGQGSVISLTLPA